MKFLAVFFLSCLASFAAIGDVSLSPPFSRVGEFDQIGTVTLSAPGDYSADSWRITGDIAMPAGNYTITARAGDFRLLGDFIRIGAGTAVVTIYYTGTFRLTGDTRPGVTLRDGGKPPTGPVVAPAPASVPSAPILGIATRAVVAPGGVLNPGFVVGGTVARRVMVRAVGPGLAQFNVSGFMVNPSFRVFNGAGVEIASNDDHGGLIAAVAGALGAFPLPLASRDAALVLTLAPGSYSAVVRGGAGEGGDVLVEVYFVD